jgi:shikimate dehydrogenase
MTMSKSSSSNVEVAAIIGLPVAQSLSPAMHNAVFHYRDDGWTYIAMEVEIDAVENVLRTLGANTIQAFSVTMPHKEAVYTLLNAANNGLGEVDESGVSARSVNTISVRDGRLIGSNTDGDGCCNALEQSGVQIEGVRAVVVGAGGTARAIVAALGRRNAADIAVINRTEAHALDAASCAMTARVGSVDDIARANVVINATSVGMGDARTPIDAKHLHPNLVVLDCVYYPLETTLLREAKTTGATTVDGLWMLVHQGALQQLAWLGMVGDIHIMRQAALDELAHRVLEHNA